MSKGTVVDFRPKAKESPKAEPHIWVCQCGCSTFELLSDGTVRCPVCESVTESPDGGWYNPDNATRWEGEDGDIGPIQNVCSNGSIEFAQMQVVSYAKEKDNAAVIVFKDDGTVSVWSKVETQEQREWFKDKLDVVYGLVTKRMGEEVDLDE